MNRHEVKTVIQQDKTKKLTDMNITNEQVKQYEPLVHKIAHQFENTVTVPYEDIVQYGYEGLINAFHTYKDDKKQTFAQYAGWQIRYAILNAFNIEGSIIKHGYYQRKTSKPLSVSHIDADESFLQLEADRSCNISYIREVLSKDLEANFSARDCDIFYRVYGLKQYDYEKSKDVAALYNISNASVTIITQKIISYIQQNEEIMEVLQDML